MAVRHYMGTEAVACLTNRVSPAQATQIQQHHTGPILLGLDNDEPGIKGAITSYGNLKAAGCNVAGWLQWSAKDPEETFLQGLPFIKRPIESLLQRHATCDMLYDIAWQTQQQEDIQRWHRNQSRTYKTRLKKT